MPRKRRSKEKENNQPSVIQYVTGDVLAGEHPVKALAFGCHPEGEMNTDLTLRFRSRYPDMFVEYQRRCQSDPAEFGPGESMMVESRDGTVIFVLGTQTNKYLSLASQKDIETAFRTMRQQMEEANITSLGMPPIGAGLGALQWRSSRRDLEKVFKGWQGQIFVYVK